MQHYIHKDCNITVVSSYAEIIKMIVLLAYRCLFEIRKPLHCLQNEAVCLYWLSMCIVTCYFYCSISCSSTGSLVVMKSMPRLISHFMSLVSFTVQAFTFMPKSWDSLIHSGCFLKTLKW